jgi:hypothetical protein
LIGYYFPDFVVETSVIVEIKALKVMDNSHLAQVIAYLGRIQLFDRSVDQFWRTKPSIPASVSMPPYLQHISALPDQHTQPHSESACHRV